MSKYSITAPEVTNMIRTLEADNTQFRARISELMDCAVELAAMWQGEANDRFNTALNNDHSRWVEFAALIDQYNEAMVNVVNIYSNAESANVDTSTTRTY